MRGRFYITTPIYYVNDVPHIGHAYTTVAADILARRNRLLGKEVFFLTGTDEHGQKVEKAAAEKGRTPKEHADSMVENFKQLWKKLSISNDAFIRTTDGEHIKTVQGLMQMLWDRGEIEKRSYSGWYCTPDERFWTEKELVGGNCPDCGRPVEHIQEENYFFLMSKYQERLISYIEDNPSYILPEARRNEVLGFLRNNILGDLCISRPKQRLSWGIPLPFDEDFVTYVWFDALVNYFSATRYLAPGSDKAGRGEFWWPASHHLVGKDILTTHAVYWSTMLMALKFPLPGNIFAHGWWTVEGRKMSKSLGNVVDPHVMIDKYGVDAFRYFLFREVPFGLDGDFSEEALIRRINTDLANDLGNLLSRFLTMAEKYFEGIIPVPSPGESTTAANELARVCVSQTEPLVDDENFTNWKHLRFNTILERVWNIISASNNFIASEEPWKLFKDNREWLRTVMFSIWNGLRLVAIHIYPFMPGTAEKIWRQLGLKSLADEVESASLSVARDDEYAEIFTWAWTPAYEIRVSKGEQLFPRIEKGKVTGENPPASPFSKGGPQPSPPLAKGGKGGFDSAERSEKKEKKGMTDEDEKELLSIEDFAKVELKIGRVMSAERVERSDKLIKLKVDIGEERQIVAGLGKAYDPEYLVGKEVVVVANLKPAKLMGMESRGMLLAATDDGGKPSILVLDREVKPGARVK